MRWGLVFLAACGGSIQAPPTCTDLHAAIEAWRERCGFAHLPDIEQREALFCAAVANAPGINHEPESACIDALRTAECIDIRARAPRRRSERSPLARRAPRSVLRL